MKDFKEISTRLKIAKKMLEKLKKKTEVQTPHLWEKL
jgi:hypothetical protein